ncbi:MAG TPA: ATP-binding protein, partial [Fibrobacteria bacterium]|nr:ATP-binding protein [Fibrobacteria bacterium]
MADFDTFPQNKRLSLRMEAVGRLAGGIAHDFNNILTTINGYAELIIGRLSPADANRPMLEEIRKAGDRATAITRQLLTLSRKQQASPVSLDVNDLVKELDPMLARTLGSGIALEIRLAPSVRPIHADPGLVGEALLNLVRNGKDALETGGRIVVSTFDAEVDGTEDGWYLKPSPGQYVCVKVEDTGKSMDAEAREHLFEPFSSTKTKERGAGLGLSTVYGILDQGRGGIRVESEEGRGNAFHAYFPVMPDRIPAMPERQARLTETTAPSGSVPHRGTILVVDDEENIRHMVSSMLTSQGYRVLEAGGAREA